MTMVDGNVHAFIWLPRADYNLTAGLHDLHALANLDGLGIEHSVATAINDAGQGVGAASDGIGLADGEAWLWRVNDTSAGFTPNASLHTSGGEFSIAHGINNASTAEVVGAAEFLCPSPSTKVHTVGFLRTVNPTSTMAELSPSGSTLSYAIDVIRSTQLWIAGRDDGGGTCDFVIVSLACHAPDRDGLIWQAAGAASFVVDRWMPPGGVEARSVNSQGDSVGFGFAQAEPCPQLAFRWDSSGDLSNLGAVMPAGQADENCRAEAIGNPGQFNHVRVAGSNETDRRVYVWEHNGTGAWSAPNLCVVDVHDEVVLCGQSLTFQSTHDMNNNGHIVVDAKDTMNNEHVVVLGCVADINHDMRVNVADQNILHAAYGACGNCNNCPSDLDCDCDVDESDFAQLLATWSGNATCRIVNFCPDSEGGEGFAGESSLVDQMIAALEATGFSSAEEYLNWASSVDPADAENISYLIHVLMTE